MSSSLNEFIPTRKSLLTRIRNPADDESWNDFFNTYWKLIYNASIQAGLGDAEAKDVVQETLIGVSKCIGEFEYNPEVCSFKSWLRVIVRRRIADQYRRRRPENPVPEYGPEHGASSETLNQV